MKQIKENRKVVLERFKTQITKDKQTLGTLWVLECDNSYVFHCYTLELPDKDNKNNISKIPKGKYTVVKRWSNKHKDHFHLLNVPNRDLILIHTGNYYTQIEGCILPGTNLIDINNDKVLDVTSSGNVMSRLLQELPDTFEIEII